MNERRGQRVQSVVGDLFLDEALGSVDRLDGAPVDPYARRLLDAFGETLGQRLGVVRIAATVLHPEYRRPLRPAGCRNAERR